MGLMFGKLLKSKVVGEINFGEWIDLAIRILIIRQNLDGFSLANHRRFTKFIKPSCCQTFLLLLQ